jgi:excisionase family DNA binding protein
MAPDNGPSEFLTVEELAERWRTTPGGIHNMRHRGRAPRAHRLGKRVLFRRDDVAVFEASRADAVRG